MKQLGHHKAGSTEFAGLRCSRAAAEDALQLHFSSRLTQTHRAVDLACAGLESLRSKLNSAFDFSIASSTQRASRPPYLLFWGEKNFAFPSYRCCSFLLKCCECSPSQQHLLRGGVRKGAVAREEALGSLCREHQLCPNRWPFLTAEEALLFVAYPGRSSAGCRVPSKRWVLGFFSVPHFLLVQCPIQR